jgi:serine/threonine protein kinase
MAYIHVKSDVHRDISYSNVMITDSGDIKVLDFGFARNDDDTNYDTTYVDIVHKFNPPDSIYDVRTEVYCMGAILFTIFTEMEFHISKLSQIDSLECEDVFKTAIKKCLQINPDDRFQNAIELQNYIESKYENSKKQLNPTYENEDDDFSLDPFKNEMENIGRIRFVEGSLPTLSTIKSWLEVKFTDWLLRHRFLSTINITQLLMQINGVRGISTYKNVNYDIDKEIFSNIINAYERFSEVDKTYLIKGIQTIILSKSVEEEDIPF